MSDTQQRIDGLVKSNDVVLFMKGSASFPMCGFSGRAIQILKACGVDTKGIVTVNVLDDEDIALWFICPNADLDGVEPLLAVMRDPVAVLEAADGARAARIRARRRV